MPAFKTVPVQTKAGTIVIDKVTVLRELGLGDVTQSRGKRPFPDENSLYATS